MIPLKDEKNGLYFKTLLSKLGQKSNNNTFLKNKKKNLRHFKYWPVNLLWPNTTFQNIYQHCLTLIAAYTAAPRQ